jgi:HK97 family phage major capsid protein/HK97 family phage prohead protease
MTTKKRPENIGTQCRSLILRAAGAESKVDLDARTCVFPFSSEEPVPRWFGDEILSHAKGSMRTGTRQGALPLLFNHNRDDLLGVIENITLGNDQRAYCTVRFGRDDRGDWAMQQANDGVLINASFMYQVFKYEEDLEEETYTATDWEVFEISLVTIPADATVGLGRAAETNETNVVEIVTRSAQTPAPAGSTLPNSGETMKTRHVLQDQANDGTGAGQSSGGAAASNVVDLERARTDARTEERVRVAEIDAMCRSHKLPDEMRNNLINHGNSLAEARGIVLNEIGKRGEQKPLTSLSDDIGLNDKEKRSYSLMRAVSAIVNSDWSGAGFEREVSSAIAKRSGRELGNTRFFFPNDLPFAPTEEHQRAYWAMQRSMVRAQQQRAIYQVGTAGQGGNLVATNLLADSFIEVLRNQSVTSMLGATFLPGLIGNVDIPRQISATGTYWVGESGALTEAEATWDKVSLRPKTIGALSKVSRLMLLQSTPAIEMLARRDLLAVGALAIDLAAMSGSGASNQPTGIVNQAGVGSVIGGTNGALLTFDNVIQLQYATKSANAPQASTGYAMNSKTIGYLSTLKATTGQYLWDPQGGLTNNSPDRLKGRPYAESQQLRSNLVKGSSGAVCSEVVYGNWQELLIGEWGITEIAVNPYDSTGFANGDVILRMFQTIDIGVRHGASFSVMSDALTTGF